MNGQEIFQAATAQKLKAGSNFPLISVPVLTGGRVDLGAPKDGFDWKLVVVYRGKHCPMCTTYLQELSNKVSELAELGVDVAVVSADTEQKARDQMELVKPVFPVGFDLSMTQMTALGLYISDPRSAEETDRPFSEPGLFVLNAAGEIQVIDISNAPFARPSLETLIGGLRFIRNPDNNYPIRGTRSA